MIKKDYCRKIKSKIIKLIIKIKEHKGKIIRANAPYIYLETGASFSGWGTIKRAGNATHDRWEFRENSLHLSLNLLELSAIFFLLYVNTTIISYLRAI